MFIGIKISAAGSSIGTAIVSSVSHLYLAFAWKQNDINDKLILVIANVLICTYFNTLLWYVCGSFGGHLWSLMPS